MYAVRSKLSVATCRPGAKSRIMIRGHIQQETEHHHDPLTRPSMPPSGLHGPSVRSVASSANPLEPVGHAHSCSGQPPARLCSRSGQSGTLLEENTEEKTTCRLSHHVVNCPKRCQTPSTLHYNVSILSASRQQDLKECLRITALKAFASTSETAADASQLQQNETAAIHVVHCHMSCNTSRPP